MSVEEIPGLVKEVAERFERLGFQLAVAESCTGGQLAAAITDLAGVSSFFLGGVVSYSDDVKHALLGVPREVLGEHGAVSEPTARAMAAAFESDSAATSGLGSPGSPGPRRRDRAEPVGIVYIAVATPTLAACREDVWPGDRAAIRGASVGAALRLLLDTLG